MFKEEFMSDFNEAVDTKEDAKALKEFKSLLNKAYMYGNRNLESDWAENTVLYSLEQVIDYTDQLKGK